MSRAHPPFDGRQASRFPRECRRAFVRTGMRYLLLAGVLLLGARLIRRGLNRPSDCRKSTRCDRCRELAWCDLAPARTARRNLQSL